MDGFASSIKHNSHTIEGIERYGLSSPFLNDFPFILFFLQFVSSVTSVTYIFFNCDHQFNYTNTSSVFQNNLKHLLTNLSSQTPLTNFYNSTFGRNENTVYALSFCPAYVAAQDCQVCVQYASYYITQYCPNQKKAIIYYVECVVRYANYSFFSTEDQDPGVYWNSSISFYNPDRLDQVLANTVAGLITKAVFGSSTTKFATGEAKIIGSRQLYCFMQCIPDITERVCRNCLQLALANLQYNTYGKEWGLVYKANCQTRYGLVAFYDVVIPPSVPSAAPPPLQPSSVMPKLENVFDFVWKKRNTSATFISTITLAAILVILGIFIGSCFIVRKVKSSGEATENEDSTPSIESLQFDFGTIRDATDNFFDVNNKLGEGGFGPVYKCASKWARIAVKKLSGNSRQGQEEFKNEVLLLTKLRHKNLVSLLGFCLEEKELLLIYEFMPNKSLDHFIFGQKIFCIEVLEKQCNSRYVDSTLMTGPESEIMRCIHIGLLCVQENAADRPTMAIVVSMLISTSFSLSLLSHPAFLLPERQGQGNLSHE
ncbi:unnamed protein product [Camellia sinensis]